MGRDYKDYRILASDSREVWYKLSYVMHNPAVSNFFLAIPLQALRVPGG
jgi:hypothetical protein